jgi:exopolysaccharide biosynthesis protein
MLKSRRVKKFMRVYIKVFLRILALGCISSIACGTASNYSYKKLEKDRHVIHLVTLPSKFYDIQIIKAQRNQDGGRETVSAIAKRAGAKIAINGGFFEIGGKQDGMPSGTLVINGHVYGMQDKKQPLLSLDANTLSIKEMNPKNTLSNSISIVSGIPLLVEKGNIIPELDHQKSSFYIKPHARTAIGIKPNGDILLVVSEHQYTKDLSTVSTGEIQVLMQNKGSYYSQKYGHHEPDEITLKELKEILKEEYTIKNGTIGLTVLELAHLMQNEGCQYAINLDGGGSSTLWLEDKVVNRTIGDVDEGNSQATERPVSDAIVFKKK